MKVALLIARLSGFAIASMVAGCGGVQSPLFPAGEQAGRVFSLLQVMLWVCGGVYLLVMAFLGWSLWRARRPAATAPAGDEKLDRGLRRWIALVLAGLTILIVTSFLTDRFLARPLAGEAIDIRVTAQQWWWRIAYRDPASGAWIETADELHLPVGRTARVTLASSDVIHSFWVPNVAGKMDVIPGRRNVIHLTPRRLGWFRGQCAEFCGTQHALMALDVKVETADDFRAWLSLQARDATPPTDATLVRGMKVVTEGACAQCHVVRGTAADGRPGPDLTHVGSRRTLAAGALPMSRGALQGWIVQPQALKPGTLMPAVGLEPVDADAAARFLESLR